MNKMITIVTPYFKAFKYINRYLDSLRSQTCKDFEVILIDDASCDGKIAEIEEKFIAAGINYSIKINSVNLGPGVSRNIGLEQAKGDFVLFLDADDWLHVDAIKKIQQVISKNYDDVPDVICFNWYKVVNNSCQRRSVFNFETGSDDKDLVWKINTSTLGKAYKLKTLRSAKVQFYPGYLGEDMYFTVLAILSAKGIKIIDDSLYYYVVNKGSLTNTKSENNIKELKQIVLSLKERLSQAEGLFSYLYLREYLYGAIKYRNAELSQQMREDISNYPYHDIIKFSKYLKWHQFLLVICCKAKLHWILRWFFKCWM